MKNLTLGSLFSGSGSFELAGMLSGIKPIWLSEIEPYPILVTHNRLPDVQHFGDVNKLNGAELPVVDIITGGFPCTDVSQAGKRLGLHAARTGLFFQFMRIVKEMREATNGKYPRLTASFPARLNAAVSIGHACHFFNNFFTSKNSIVPSMKIF